ncbi:MAG: RHS domain-containing protein [Acidobacteriota bacterium]|nr:RHS domain-containing protein [Acidobacteriota bacterium]
MPAVNDQWKTTATITGNFKTRTNGRQYLRLVRNGNIHDVVAEKSLRDGEQNPPPWTFPVDLTCKKGPITFHAVAMTCGDHWSVTPTNPIPSDSSLIEWSEPIVLEIEATPTATLKISEPGPTGLSTATVTGIFNYKVAGRRYVRLFRNGNIHDVVRQERADDNLFEHSFPVPLNFACTSGTTTYEVAAMICGDHWSVTPTNPIPADPDFIGYSGEVPMSDEADPTVSVSSSTANGIDTGLIEYSFPSTSTQAQRDLTIFIDDGPGATVSMAAHSGTHPVTLPACWKKLRVVATACDQSGNQAFTDEDEIQNPLLKPTVDLTLRKLGIDPDTGRRIIGVITKYNVKQPPGRVRVKLKAWKDADGQEHPSGVLLRDLNPPENTSGTDGFTFVAPSGAQQVGLTAIVEGCETVKADAWIDCSPCDKGGASKNPVYYNDGNMRLTDTDPLPLIANQPLTRTYNSDEQVVGRFGRGWTTLFDRRLVMDDDGAVSLSTGTNEVVTFREVAGVLVQTWPTAAVAGTLVRNAAAGTYTWRGPVSSEVAVFRESDGRLLVLRDLTSGHEAQIGYDAAGLPQSLTDSWSGVSWTLTVAQGKVTSIAISDRPDIVWTYSYDADGNLMTVSVSGGTWRTYEYAANRMTASRDALGNLIESHTYDANGFAVSSTGDVDEIALLEYGLPGSVPEELVTRVTYKTGATAEMAMRPIGGSYRTVRTTGGCAGCGAGDATYVRDERGRVIREQSADGYVAVRVYDGEHVQSEESALKPAGCDPQTDAQHCRLGTDALAIAALEPTSATVKATYEHGDALWPDRITAVTRPSVRVPGQFRRETYAYHQFTGVVSSAVACGWDEIDNSPSEVCRNMTYSTFYEYTALPSLEIAVQSAVTPVFDPGGVFLSSWLVLRQPHGPPKSIGGPGNFNKIFFVYYPIDASVPALLRGRLAATKNAAGHITRYEDYDIFGNVTRVVDPNGVATEMTFDTLGRQITTTTKAVAGCNTAVDPLCGTDLATTNTYSPSSGPLQSQEHPGGGVTSYAYDARGRMETVSRGPSATDLHERIETSYDSLTGKKNLERTLGYEGGSWVEKSRQSFAYDTQARLTTITHADGATLHYAYDSEDRIATTRDENHAAPNTTYAYDEAGRLQSVTQTLAGASNGVITTSYSYDTNGNLTSVTDPNGNITSYIYDDFGQLSRQQSPVTGTTTYAYDGAGNLMQLTDANGATTTRLYDALDRVTTATSTLAAATEVVSWSYDDATAGRFAIGRLASMTDPSGSTAYSYERRGLLRDETRTLTGAQYTYTTAFEYDADGNRAAVKYPSTQLTVQYGFDYAGRPTSASGFVTAAEYLPFGPLKSLSFANGTTQSMAHDTRYRISSNSLIDSNTIAQYTYTHDAASNITLILDATDPTYDRTFQYDDLNRLVTLDTGTSLWRRGSYSWDAMGNMLSLKLGEIEKGPTDPLDQFRDPRKWLRTEENIPLGRSSTFTYDETGAGTTTARLSEVTTNDLSRPVTYDDAGNETAYVATRVHSPRNLLAKVTDPSEPGDPEAPTDPTMQHTVSYAYDGRGIRVARAESPADGPGTVARRFSIYTPELQLMAVTRDDASNIWTYSAEDKNIDYEIVWFAGRPVAQVTSGGATLYTFTDHLGTPILQTDSAKSVTWRAEYEPFGNVYEMRSGYRTDQPLRFPGQEVAMSWEGQEENYNIFRWYRSGWGRYTQADPVGVVQLGQPDLQLPHINLFNYVSGRPLTLIDPLGLSAACASGKCADCKSGVWTTTKLTDKAFFVWGWSWESTTTYRCVGSTLYCTTVSQCEALGAGFSLSVSVSGGLAGAGKCNCIEDLSKKDSIAVGGFGVGASLSNGPCWGVDAGVSKGAGSLLKAVFPSWYIAAVKCKSKSKTCQE